ncbi:hypothetical protein AGMMS49592_3450 [Endomicrobiia bacterium]|nr:hypothetical protein AGMMS49592_3450 [Endomicrobiia bacterium]
MNFTDSSKRVTLENWDNLKLAYRTSNRPKVAQLGFALKYCATSTARTAVPADADWVDDLCDEARLREDGGYSNNYTAQWVMSEEDKLKLPVGSYYIAANAAKYHSNNEITVKLFKRKEQSDDNNDFDEMLKERIFKRSRYTDLFVCKEDEWKKE